MWLKIWPGGGQPHRPLETLLLKQNGKPTITVTSEVKMKASKQLGSYCYDPSGQWWKPRPGWQQ